MNERELSALETALAMPTQDLDRVMAQMSLAVRMAPKLIAEIRRLRAMRALGVTIPPDPSEAEDEAVTAEGAQAIVRDVGEMIGECCPEGGAFLLTLFDTRGDYEPVYTFNASHEDTLKALRRVAELVEQS